MWRRWPVNRRTTLAPSSWNSLVAKPFSSVTPHETIAIQTHADGPQLTLDIHHPTSTPPPSSNVPPTILIYLPRGPLQAKEAHDASTISLLRTSLPWTIVRLNYDRLLGAPDARFPAPIHNVLAGYDWCHEHLLPKRSISRSGRSQHVGRVVVCGELVGGGLASMLALTECRTGQPGIVAAALNNPITDWVALGDGPSPSSRTAPHAIGKKTLLETNLLALRTQLFRTPEAYFDPFASPILFFRSAGIDIPSPPPLVSPDAQLEDEFEQLRLLSRSEEDSFFHSQQTLSALSQPSSHPAPESQPTLTTSEYASMPRKVKASRRFPSPSLKLRLPQFHISASLTPPLSAQAVEFTHQLRLSVARQSGRSAASFGRKILVDDEKDDDDENARDERRQLDAEAEAKVQLTLDDGRGPVSSGGKKGLKVRASVETPMGLWDDSAEGRGRVMGVVKWLKETLS